MKAYLKYVEDKYEYGLCGMSTQILVAGVEGDEKTFLDIEIQMLDNHVIRPEHKTYPLITKP